MGLLGKIVATAAGVLGGIGIIAAGEKIAENKRKERLEQERLEEEKRVAKERLRHQLEQLKQERLEEERLEQKRKNTPCYFNNGISQNEFYSMIYEATKHIKRVTVSVDGPIIYGTVRTQSGISTWNFKIDFNDFGKITGKHWIWCENDDSDIPYQIAKEIQFQIYARLSTK